MRYFMTLSYDGRSFHGWQTQPGAVTVQQTIEEALSMMLRRPVAIVGAGRTDAGVNARKMVAHVDLPELDSNDDATRARFIHSLNSLVGRAIAIESILPVAPDAHARFDARRRTYRYFVHHRKDPFCERFSLQIAPLDYEAMNAAARLLLDIDDFTSFAKLHSDARTNICHVDRAEWVAMDDEGNRHYFEISADRFLRNMVRAVVGTLVEVGSGKMTIEQFRDVINRRNRCAAGTSMPGNALFLWNVEY